MSAAKIRAVTARIPSGPACSRKFPGPSPTMPGAWAVRPPYSPPRPDLFSPAESPPRPQAPAQREAAPASNLEASTEAPAPLRADSTIRISFERPAVRMTAAPVIEKPAAARAVPWPAAAIPVPAAKAQIAASSQASAAPADVPAAGGVNATTVSAAYAQPGPIQDCTRLVEKALGAAGIPVGDLGPTQFMKCGKVVRARSRATW